MQFLLLGDGNYSTVYHCSAHACSNMPSWWVQWQLEIVAACILSLESIRAPALFMYQAVCVCPPPKSALYYSYHKCREVILAVYIYIQGFVIFCFPQDVIILLFTFGNSMQFGFKQGNSGTFHTVLLWKVCFLGWMDW